MRIMFLSPSGHLGGAEVCLLDMISVLRNARPEWQVAAILGEDGPLAKRVHASGAQAFVVPFPKEIAARGDSGFSGSISAVARMLGSAPSVLSYRRQLKEQLLRFQPDIIHSNGLKMHLFGALTKLPDSKLVWHLHDYVSSRPIMAKLLSRFSTRADLVIANSRNVAEDADCVVGRSRTRAILNAVDLNEFSPGGATLDLDSAGGLLPAPAGTVRVGLIATMAWWKGHRLFLEAVSKLDRKLPIRAYVIGGAVYQTGSKQESIELLRKYAVELGIGDRVGFTGFVSNPANAMRALDVVVHASTEPEPFGRVITEAMACGKPVISSGVGGAEEILSLGDAAVKFAMNDSQSLSSTITRLATDEALRARLGQNGLSIARLHFSRERLADELLPIYESLSEICEPAVAAGTA